MRRASIIVAAFILGATAVAAQNVAVIKERQDALKAIGDAVKPVGAMYKGEADFDLAKVQAALKVIQEKAAILPPLFPDDSKTGGDTEALPIIWDEKADFESRYKKLGDSAKAAEAAITDEETFPDAWKEVMGNCSGCHKKFRKPKS
jgi:cytochrome c556